MFLFYFQCHVFVFIKNKHTKLQALLAFFMGKLHIVLFLVRTIITVT